MSPELKNKYPWPTSSKAARSGLKIGSAAPKEGAQSIHRAIAVLRAVAHYKDQGAGLSKIARSVGLTTTTTHRILHVLTIEGFVTYDPIAKLYHLGLELFILGGQAQRFSIREAFRIALERIAEKTEDTTYLVMQSGSNAVCLDRVVGKFPIQVLTFEVGERRPMGIGAGSLALLASLPDHSIEAIIESNAKGYQAFHRTIEDVRNSVAHCRRLGYGLSEKTVSPDTIGVGTTIRDPEGKVIAAVSVAGIAKRMGIERREAIVRLINEEIAASGLNPLKKKIS
jgi:DNA-binding IclR family transcriptional regulator